MLNMSSSQVRVEVVTHKLINPTVELEQKIFDHLKKLVSPVRADTVLKIKGVSLSNSIYGLIICDDLSVESVEISHINFIYYKFSDFGSQQETIGDDEDQTPASQHYILPNKELFGLYESLIYDEDIKQNLLNFVETTMMFSNKDVDQNIISCNRLVLLHGSPGTGKTSLARAIAQKLSITLSKSYKFFHLFEINSHALFSKWFSESGKLVQKMFQQIQEVIEIESSLVCVLIDEVESLAFSRNALSSNEPSDAVRSVNSTLTQLDRIKRFPNVLILTTSNLTASIDLAFLDRADIVQYVGSPSVGAIYRILFSALTELVKVGIVIETDDDDFKLERINSFIINKGEQQINSNSGMIQLLRISELCVGVSGRILRKLPFLAHALFLKQKETVTMPEYLAALKLAVEKHLNDTGNISKIDNLSGKHK